jgi:hypothetical protein
VQPWPVATAVVARHDPSAVLCGHRGGVSRSGALIATAWAAMRHLGVQGFQDATKDILRAVSGFRECLESIPELVVMGTPACTVVAFTSLKKTFNIYQVCANDTFCPQPSATERLPQPLLGHRSELTIRNGGSHDAAIHASVSM